MIKFRFRQIALVAILLCSASFTISADDPNGTDPTIILKRGNKEKDKGNRIPSRMHIVCYYLDGAFWFEPNFDTAYLDVTVTDQYDIIVADGTVTDGTPLYLPMLTDGTYTVACTTDTDAAYYGTMTVTQ